MSIEHENGVSNWVHDTITHYLSRISYTNVKPHSPPTPSLGETHICAVLVRALTDGAVVFIVAWVQTTRIPTALGRAICLLPTTTDCATKASNLVACGLIGRNPRNRTVGTHIFCAKFRCAHCIDPHHTNGACFGSRIICAVFTRRTYDAGLCAV